MYELFGLSITQQAAAGIGIVLVVLLVGFGLWLLLCTGKWERAIENARRAHLAPSKSLTPTTLKSTIVGFFRLQNKEKLFDLALKPRSYGGRGRCEEMAMIGDRLLDLVVVKELLLRAERVAKFVSRKKIQHWVTTEKKEYVTNDVLAKFAYKMGVETLLPKRGSGLNPANRDLGTICEALLGACAEVKGDTVACLVAKEMMVLMDNALFDVLQTLFQRTGHEMFELVRVDQVSNSDYLRMLVDMKKDGVKFDQFTEAVIQHEEKLLKTGKPLTEKLLYTYEVSLKAYCGFYGVRDHFFRGIPHPDSSIAKRKTMQAFMQPLLVIQIPGYIGRRADYLCLDPRTNITRGREPILQFLRRDGEHDPPRYGAPPPGCCGLPVMSINPMTLAIDQIHGLYSCHQSPPESAIHPCSLDVFANYDGAYKHGGIILFVPKELIRPRNENKQSITRGRRRGKK